MSSMKVGLFLPYRLHFSEIMKDEFKMHELDFLKERKDDSQGKIGVY